ncbi:MAG TPA: hypothetical protein VKY27_08935 [Bacteriovoracaceae bacterium]|nr:hypothetical protein [Bacteriovoracaceae bacterium]
MKRLFNKNFVLAVISVICYAIAFTQPMWKFKFIAPQYPSGLELDIFLTGARGDVVEIDIINHYIGMQKLEHAAKNEKALAPYVLISLSLLSLGLGLFPRKKLLHLLSLAMIGFPLAFITIFQIWLYKFGHDLDPAAPVTLSPFTPVILGEGVIGQFRTYALPGIGFYLSVFAALCVATIVFISRKECRHSNT